MYWYKHMVFECLNVTDPYIVLINIALWFYALDCVLSKIHGASFNSLPWEVGF